MPLLPMMMMLTCCLHSLSLRAKSPRKKALGQLHHRAAAAAVTAAVVADLSLENKKKRENQIQIAGAVLEWEWGMLPINFTFEQGTQRMERDKGSLADIGSHFSCRDTFYCLRLLAFGLLFVKIYFEVR